MRVGILVGCCATIMVGLMLAVGTIMITGSGGRKQETETRTSICNAAVGPTQPGQQGRGVDDAADLSEEQRETVSLIISIGMDRDLSPRAWQVAIQAGMTESGLRNLQYGDRDSLGIFQMRPSMGWGTKDQVTDPPYQVNKFYDVLESVPEWQQMRPGDAAQAVERSAFPDRYHRWEPMAVHLMEKVGDVENAAGCGEERDDTLAPNEGAESAIRYALEEQGKPYVWGDTGPDSYDCSGLTLRAYEAAGVTLPRVSQDQYHAGAMLPVEQAQRGDLLFWAYDSSNPSTIHHVAIYLGDGEIVEAQQPGVPIHTRDVSWDESGLLPQAVRPGA